MTREQAIAVLQTIKPTPCRGDGKSTTHTLEIIAIDMAIKALEQEPYEDCISREQALKEFEKDQYHREYCIEHGIDRSISMEMVRIRLHDLPSVQPQPKTGRWIPVSERLPEKYSYTLWCASSGCVRSDYFNGEFWEDAKKYCYEVIAWMPLPKPYKAESEEQA